MDFLFEFQGEFTNFDLFDGVFDTEKLQYHFKTFYLQGRKVSKPYTVFEKVDGNLLVKTNIQDVILFDKPPKYNIKNKFIN